MTNRSWRGGDPLDGGTVVQFSAARNRSSEPRDPGLDDRRVNLPTPFPEVPQALSDASQLASAMVAMEAVARVATAIARALDTPSVVDAILADGEQIGVRATILFEADEERQELRLIGHRGIPPPYLERLAKVRFDGQLLTSLAARTRRTQFLISSDHDNQDLELARELMLDLPAESLCAIPLVSRGKLVGVRTLALREGRRPTADDLWVIRTVAEVMAVGLAHARIFDEQKKLLETVEVERATLDAVLRSAPYPILFFEAGTTRVHANLRAQELFGGWTPEDRIADVRGEFLRPDGRKIPVEDFAPVRVLKGEAESIEEEVIFVRADGKRTPLFGRTGKVLSRDGRMLGVVTLCDDISAEKELEHLHEEWSSIAAHDMRQPLNLVTMAFSMLERSRESLPPLAQRSIEHGKRGAMSLERLIRDLSDVSRIASGRLTLEKRRMDLCQAVHAIAEQQRMTSAREICVEVRGEPAAVEGDPIRLDEIMTNLISNAVKYSPAGSTVSVSLCSQGDGVLVEVTNPGAGISADELPHLFERYYRTNTARTGQVTGLGLGLFITKGLVEAHGGRISVQSTVGERTTFSVWLPACVC